MIGHFTHSTNHAILFSWNREKSVRTTKRSVLNWLSSIWVEKVCENLLYVENQKNVNTRIKLWNIIISSNPQRVTVISWRFYVASEWLLLDEKCQNRINVFMVFGLAPKFSICLRSFAKTNSNSQFRRLCWFRIVSIPSQAIVFHDSSIKKLTSPFDLLNHFSLMQMKDAWRVNYR